MMNRKAYNYLALCIRAMMEDSKVYSPMVSDIGCPWSLYQIVDGVRAVIALNGDACDDGWNPQLNERLSEISKGVDEWTSSEGDHHLFQVTCEVLASDIGDI